MRAVVGPSFTRNRSSSASWAFAGSTGVAVRGPVGCGSLSDTVDPTGEGRFVAVVLAAATWFAVSDRTAPVPSFLPRTAIAPPTAPSTTTAPTTMGTTARFLVGAGTRALTAVAGAAAP